LISTLISILAGKREIVRQIDASLSGVVSLDCGESYLRKGLTEKSPGLKALSVLRLIHRPKRPVLLPSVAFATPSVEEGSSFLRQKRVVDVELSVSFVHFSWNLRTALLINSQEWVEQEGRSIGL
jgi:hypothetical protein